MAMSTSWSAVIESVDDDIGFEISDDPNCVFDYSLLAPYGKGFIRMFGISKIIGSSKKLLSAVYAACGQELLRPNDA